MIIIYLGFFLAESHAAIQDTTIRGKSRPVKAIWVVRDALKSRESIDEMLVLVRKAGFTDVFLQVRGRGDAYYNSRLVPKAEGVDPDFDPLTYLFSKTRSESFRVHAWVNVFLIWSADQEPRDSSHVLLGHPEWSAVSDSDISMIGKGIKQIKREGDEGIFFTPAADGYQDHFMSVVEELISNYPFNGVHLDYIRYPRFQYDYSESMRSKFMLRYHIDPLQMVQNRNQKVNPYPRPQLDWIMNSWNDFRRSAITSLVKKIRNSLQQNHPDIYLSAAVFAGLEESENMIFQPWLEWVRDSTVDFVVTMNYATDNRTFEKRVKETIAWLGAPAVSRKVVVGLSLYNQSQKGVMEKIKILKKNDISSLSFFSYETLRSQPAYLNVINAP